MVSGNFIFYDLAQYKIGSCRIEEIGIRMICPIVSVYKESRDLVLMGGYSKGQDKSIDAAHQIWPKIVDFMKQDSSEKDTLDGSYEKLKILLENTKQNVK